MSSANMLVATTKRARSPVLSPARPHEGSVVLIPTLDVIRGRGGYSNANPGNQRLLRLVRPLRPLYDSLNVRGQKGKKALEIVDQVHAWGGRFLEEEIDSDGKQLILDKEGAKKLVQQKFRDSEPAKRKLESNCQCKVAKKSKTSSDGPTVFDAHEEAQQTSNAIFGEQSAQTDLRDDNADDLDAKPYAYDGKQQSAICISPMHLIDDPPDNSPASAPPLCQKLAYRGNDHHTDVKLPGTNELDSFDLFPDHLLMAHDENDDEDDKYTDLGRYNSESDLARCNDYPRLDVSLHPYAYAADVDPLYLLFSAEE